MRERSVFYEKANDHSVPIIERARRRFSMIPADVI